MPCQVHSHKPWPQSGSQRLLIEACETICGWCNREFKPASNLRAHARRHVASTKDRHLNNITVVKKTAGRARLAMTEKPPHAESNQIAEHIFRGGYLEDTTENSTTNASSPANSEDNTENARLRERITFLDGVLKQRGLPVPPQVEVQTANTSPSASVPFTEQLFSCLFMVEGHRFKLEHDRLYCMAMEYANHCQGRESHDEQADPIKAQEFNQQFGEELQQRLKVLDKRIEENNGHVWNDDYCAAKNDALMAGLIQFVVNQWLWGSFEIMSPNLKLLLRITDYIGLRELGVDSNLGKVIAVTEIVIALADESIPELGNKLHQLKHIHPPVTKVIANSVIVASSWTRREYEVPLTPLGYTANAVYSQTLALARSVIALGTMPRSSDDSIRAAAVQNLMVTAKDINDLILDRLKAEKGNLFTTNIRGHTFLSPLFPDNSSPNHRQEFKSHFEKRRCFLVLTATQLYVSAIATRTRMSRGDRTQFQVLWSGISEIPFSYWRGKECQFMWVILPLLNVLGVDGIDTLAIGISKVERRYFKTMFLHAAKVYAMENWQAAKDFLQSLIALYAWLRHDDETQTIILPEGGG